MRLALLTALVMVAFAANSVLNRAAVAAGEIGALEPSSAGPGVAEAAGAGAADPARQRVPSRCCSPGAVLGGANADYYLVGFSVWPLLLRNKKTPVGCAESLFAACRYECSLSAADAIEANARTQAPPPRGRWGPTGGVDGGG